MSWLEDLVRDVRHGLRALRRTPVFAAVAILTLALGIGANTAILSIVNGVLLRPLAYPRPAQLMYLDTQFLALGFPQFWASTCAATTGTTLVGTRPPYGRRRGGSSPLA
jgi:hypothetical protein